MDNQYLRGKWPKLATRITPISCLATGWGLYRLLFRSLTSTAGGRGLIPGVDGRRTCDKHRAKVKPEREIPETPSPLHLQMREHTVSNGYTGIHNIQASLAKKICEILRTSGWSEGLRNMFSASSVNLSPAIVIEVVKAEKSVHLALKFCIWAASHHESIWYNALVGDPLVEAVKGSREWKEVKEMLTSVKRDGYKLPIEIGNDLIKSYCKVGLINEAIQILEQMKCSGTRPTTFSYNAILDSLVKSNKLAAAHRIHQEMGNEGCPSNKATYDIMMHNHGRAGSVREAYKTLKEMEQNGFKPDVITYTRAIDGLCKVGVIDDAYTLFMEMMSKKMVDFTRARRDEKRKTKKQSLTIAFVWHMLEDVRFGGGGCRGVACAV